MLESPTWKHRREDMVFSPFGPEIEGFKKNKNLSIIPIKCKKQRNHSLYDPQMKPNYANEEIEITPYCENDTETYSQAKNNQFQT